MSAPEPVDLLISGGSILTMDRKRTIIADGGIAVEDGAIVAAGKAADIESRFVAAKRIDATGKIVIPGLIDCHNHPIHFLSKGICDDQPVMSRWRDRVWPYEATLDRRETRLSATGTFIEMIRNGTTCFSDPGSFHPDAVAEAALETGIRGVITHLSWDVRDPSAPGYDDDTETAVAKSEETIERWNGAGGGRIRAWFSLVRNVHVTDRLCETVRDRAAALGVGIHGHLCTTREEVARARETLGFTPVERYRRLGLLGPNLVLVHMGWAEAEEVPTLAALDVSVCHCPSASMLGGFGCVSHGKFPEMVAGGVRVVLGTDACAISRFVDMVRVMYLAACAHKDARLDPTIMGAHRVFEMVTVDAARALLWDDQIGSIEPGKRADIVILDAEGPDWHPNPHANPVANLVYSASGSSVRTTIIDGRIVMEDRQITTIDEAVFLAEADGASADLLGRLGLTPEPAWPVV